MTEKLAKKVADSLRYSPLVRFVSACIQKKKERKEHFKETRCAKKKQTPEDIEVSVV